MIPRSEYPRPNFVRKNWLSLNGQWDFSFEERNYDLKINVPFACETKLSGIEETGFHPVVWYRKEFALPMEMRGKKIILHFGAVDYQCKVWVNQKYVICHVGGQNSFSVDITDVVRFDEPNQIELRVEDDPKDLEQTRGKQFWEEKSRSIFYTRTTGIWQSVWLEALENTHLVSVLITPLFDEKAVKIEYQLCGGGDMRLEADLLFDSTLITTASVKSSGKKGFLTINVDQPGTNAWNFYEDLAWSPENPRLFDLNFRVYQEDTLTDEVSSYFGMRKVSIENGQFLLNNRPYFQRLVLDQGYWPESLLTAPSDDAFIKDIELVKAMGFNGVRMHQKAEDPRFYYHADRLGLVVWGELGAAYIYSRDYARRMYSEWMDIVLRDYNHPCIVAWVPLNESWGVQEIKTDPMQQAHSMAAVALTKSLDPTRPVIDNDGWEHTRPDMLTIHDYEGKAEVLHKRYSNIEDILKYTPGGKSLYANGYSYHGEPILVSEYGGVCYAGEGVDGWGYSSDNDPQIYIDHVAQLTKELLNSPYVQGYCYTQICDVETEQNGLLTYDRKPKVPIEQIRKAMTGK